MVGILVLGFPELKKGFLLNVCLSVCSNRAKTTRSISIIDALMVRAVSEAAFRMLAEGSEGLSQAEGGGESEAVGRAEVGYQDIYEFCSDFNISRHCT